MTKKTKDFTLTPQPGDDTIADFEEARAEGWYALGLQAKTDAERLHCSYNLSEAIIRAEEAGDEPYDADAEVAFIPADRAILALRLALRALLKREDTTARHRAIEAIGLALVDVEAPE